MEEEGAPSTEQVGAQMIETRDKEGEMELSPCVERELEEAALGSMEAEMEGKEESAGLDATQRMASVKLCNEETRGSGQGCAQQAARRRLLKWSRLL
jgi:hypothetical protein